MRGLLGRLSAVLLVLLFCVGGVTLALTLATSRRHLQEVQQHLNYRLAEDVLADVLPAGEGQLRDDILEEIFHRLMVINPSIEVYLLDGQGQILAFSAPPGEVRRDRVDPRPIRAFLDGSARLPILGDDPRSEQGRKIFSAATVGGERAHEGFLYIVLASDRYESVAQMFRGSYVLRAGAGMVAGAFLLALLGGLAVFRRLTGRLTSLTGEMAKFEARELEAGDAARTGHGDGEPGDEIDRLAATFRRMAGRIRDQIRRLREADQQRRDLVASVSHDLRTPLALLHGYLETLILKSEATPQERRECLEIALQQSELLGRRVGQLFELAKLDALSAPLHRELFSVAELVQDVAQKFQVAAADRGISLSAEIDGAPAMRYADPALIERALENLIDNAIRFTPPRGRVTVRVLEEDGRVRVEVSDTGSGIPPSDLARVFEPFYRAPSTGNMSSRGSGLGLAIARRALWLHGTDIACESVEGRGTTFRFELGGSGGAIEASPHRPA